MPTRQYPIIQTDKSILILITANKIQNIETVCY